MDASYQFFYSFGYFTYCTDEYNDLTGHICISGNFKIQNDSIFFFDLSIEIPVLTELSRTSSKDIREEWIIQDSTAIKRQRPNASNFWSLIGNGIRREIKVDPSKKFSASFFRHEKDEYIEIDGEKYYGVYDPSE